MLLKDPDIFRLISKINEHFKNNINNRYMRNGLKLLNFSPENWNLVDTLMEKTEYYYAQGLIFENLYDQILATAELIHTIRTEMLPNLRNYVSTGQESGAFNREQPVSKNDKIIKDMIVSNYKSNVGIFADLINELYIKTTAIDKELNAKKKPIYTTKPELNQLGAYLVGN